MVLSSELPNTHKVLAGQHFEQGEEIVAIAKIVKQVFDAFVILWGQWERRELDWKLVRNEGN